MARVDRDKQSIERVYTQVRAIATEAMRHESAAHTLQPTALANEVFVRLSHRQSEFRSESEFVNAAVTCIRRVLIDHARKNRAQKRASRAQRRDVDLRTIGAVPECLLEFDDLLGELAKREPLSSQILELSVYGQLTAENIAQLLGMHERTVRRHWQIARAWILQQLRQDHED